MHMKAIGRHNIRQLARLLILVTIGWSLPVIAATDAGVTVSPLVGDWKLIPELSDTLESAMEKLRKMSKKKQKARAGGSTKTRNNPEGVTYGLMRNMQMVVKLFLVDEPYMEVNVEDKGMQLKFPSQARFIPTTGEAAAISARGAPHNAARNVSISGWEDGVLVVETTTELGIKVLEQYSADAEQLRVKTEIDYPNVPLLPLVRVYDRL